STLNFIERADRTLSAAEWSPPRQRMRFLDFAVVCSVIGIGALLVFPAIATLRGDQARIVCADRLRAVGVALGMYADIESNNLPYVDKTGPLNNAGSFAYALKAKELIGEISMFVCPGADSALVRIPTPEDLQAAESDPARFNSLRRSMSGSFGYLLGYEDGGEYRGRMLRQSTPVVSDRPPRASEYAGSANSPNHQFQGQNVLFSDGSIRWLTNPTYRGDALFINDAGIAAAGCRSGDAVIGVSEATPYPFLSSTGL
ncbi:MAG TPA: hypothetical protein VNC50_11520, partial [Planctomycetia bacterium]|nr:hypothetical protein [Planctomycetia bacterium]